MGVIHPERAGKLKTALRYTLDDAQLRLAQRALEHALRVHVGVRRDGVTPEWAHPVRVTLHLVALMDALDTAQQREHLLACAALHDILEDHPETPGGLAALYGPDIAHTVVLLSRKQLLDPAASLESAEYYARMQADLTAPLVKAADRVHNFSSMKGVFTLERQRAYVEEARVHILPMLRAHRRTHPEARRINLALTYMLEEQVELFEMLFAMLFDQSSS